VNYAAPVAFCYAGSKRKEQRRIVEALGATLDTRWRIAEPFAGTCRITQLIGQDGGCVANDAFEPIAAILHNAMDEDEEFFFRIAELMDDESGRHQLVYYNRRAHFNQLALEPAEPVRRAALFYYLINACHGGMVRHNPAGKFNVSIKVFLLQGRSLCGPQRIQALRDLGRKFRRVESRDALDHIEKCLLPLARSGDLDLVYCDPPYESSGMGYGAKWTRENLLALIDFAKQFQKLGVKFAISNYECGVDYAGAEVTRFQTKRMQHVKGVAKATKEDLLAVW
jgi:site-specific DNA-adenine methylase